MRLSCSFLDRWLSRRYLNKKIVKLVIWSKNVKILETFILKMDLFNIEYYPVKMLMSYFNHMFFKRIMYEYHPE